MINFIRRIIFAYKEYILLIILSLVSLSILFSNEKPQIKKLRTIALGTFSVFNEALNSVVGIFPENESIDSLKMENAKLMLEVNKLRSERMQNEELRSILNIRDTIKYSIITADIISKLVNRVEGNFIINRGTADGVSKGMPAMTSQGLVGIVSESAENFSVIRTLYNSSLNIAVTIQRSNIDGILSWNGINLIIKNVPTTYDVKIGDLVETSDFSSLFPPNIPVGIVSKKQEINIGLLHTLTVKPYADVYGVHEVFIIKVVPSEQINNLEMNLMK